MHGFCEWRCDTLVRMFALDISDIFNVLRRVHWPRHQPVACKFVVIAELAGSQRQLCESITNTALRASKNSLS